MGLFSRKENKTVNVEPEQKSFGGLLTSSLDVTKPRQISRNGAVGEYTGWVYGITNLVANNVASQQVHLYATTPEGQKGVTNFRTKSLNVFEKKELTISIEGADIEEIYGHPASQLLKLVNGYTDGFNLMYLTQLWMDLVGDAYWLIIKDNFDLPVEIQLLNPTLTQVVPNATQTDIKGYLYQVKNGKKIKFKKEDVVRFSMPNPNNKWYGVSPLIAQSGILSTLKQAEHLEYALLKNAGVPPLLLKYDGQLTPKEVRILENEWKKATTGNRQGNIKVIDANFTVEKIAQSMQDLMMTETTVLNLKAIALAYGVPYSFIDTSDQKKAGLDQLLEMMAINCVQPRLTRIQEVLNQQYIPLFDVSGDLKFAYDDPSPDAPKDEAAVINSYVKHGVMLKNEARTMLGLEVIDGLDDKPEEPVEPEKVEDSKVEDE
jgi:HK97 family phage portal protein